MEKVISFPPNESNSHHPNITPPEKNDNGCTSQSEHVPILDFSLLTAGTPDQRSKAIQLIGEACREWGFFIVTNHPISRRLMVEMVNAGKSFLDQTHEEKQEYTGKKLLDPIRCGTYLQREYLKVQAHPRFHAPDKPSGYRETAEEYSKIARQVAEELLKGMSQSLGLEEEYIHKNMEVESGFQLHVVNLYRPPPQPTQVVQGIPPHSDHGLLTILIQNEPGLEILHRGNWVLINPPPYALLVNVADHMEILTNGQYKSVMHRAMLDEKEAIRISIVSSHGPSLDTVVSPAPKLVNTDSHPPAFRGMKYGDYIHLQHSPQLAGKSCVDSLRISSTF